MKKGKVKTNYISILLVICMLLSVMVSGVNSTEAKGRPRLVKKKVTLKVGKTAKIKVKNLKKNAKISYKSNKVSIAKVNKKGKVTAKKKGKAVIKIKIKQKHKIYNLKYKVIVKKSKVINKPKELKTYVTKQPIASKKPDATAITSPTATPEIVNENVALLFGLSKSEEGADEDKDGLSDFVEIYTTGTDPLKKDTDGNGIDDGDEDQDEDGLTNIVETRLGTDLRKKDTDSDNLPDGKEVNTYSTNPLVADSDNDGIIDGNEIVLGLNPLKVFTDGKIKDSERKFQQELDKSSIDDVLMEEENDMKPLVSGKVNDRIDSHVYISEAGLNELQDNRSILGKPICLETDYKTTNLQLHFDYSSWGDNGDGLVICKYDENRIEACETEISENEIITNNITNGCYFVLDAEYLLNSLGVNINDYKRFGEGEMEKVDEDYLESLAFSKLSVTSFTGQADIVFAIDSTGSMSDAIDNVADNISMFVDTLTDEYSVKVNFALVNYKDITEDEQTIVVRNGMSNWFDDVASFKKVINSIDVDGGGDDDETPIDALGAVSELDFRSTANKFVILVTDAGYKIDNNYGYSSMNDIIEVLKLKGISTSVITDDYYKSDYFNLFDKTGGVFGDIYGDFASVLLSLADNIGEIVNDGTWVLLDDYKYVKLDKPVAVDSGDTDGDGLSDYEELGEKYSRDLTPFIKVVLKKYGVPFSLYNGQTSIDVYKYISNPALKDTDYDGIDDYNKRSHIKDIEPKNNSFKGKMHYGVKADNECDIEFSVDYRSLFEDNSTYQKDLAVMSILYASDIYDGNYIQVTDGIKGGADDGVSFGKLFGLKDCEDIKITSADYDEDKDDVTEFFVGHRNIEGYGEVIILSVRGTNGTNKEWSSNFDVGADTDEYYERVGYEHPDWENKNNHKGFDVASNRVLSKFNDYIKSHGLDSSSIKKSILITGHSRGAAIANLLGAEFEKNEQYKSFTYTFAAPNCTTDYAAEEYKTIKNVLNEDDLIPYLPLDAWGFKKYGSKNEYSISVKSSYENKFGTAEEGTFEWLIGKDYNNDGGTARTLKSFGKIAANREELYILDESNDGTVLENNIGHITFAKAEEEMRELKSQLTEEKLMRFCTLSIEGDSFPPYYVSVNYCPAYLMQTLANMTTGTGPLLGHDVKGDYASAKASFVASSGELIIGGMEHPHMQPTYYLIAHNNFVRLR